MRVLSLEELAKSETIDIQEYGLKSQGIVDLIRLRDELHLDYTVPQGFVIPASGSSQNDIEKAFFDLTANDTEKTMLLARSSSPDEEPGKFRTIPVLFDPKEKKKSLERFLKAYKNVIDKEPKAVIGQKVAGRGSERDGMKVFGLDNTSFILQIPSYNPDLIAISCVRGLADRAVSEEGSNVIFLDYDFVKKEVVRVIDKPDLFYEKHSDLGQRQIDAECFDLSNGKVLYEVIGKEFEDSIAFGRIINSEETFTVPFKDNAEIDNLAEIVTALKNRKGKPLEIEGAYVDGKLNLFQLRELEVLPIHDIKFSEGKYIIGGTDSVIGSGRYKLDLIWFISKSIKREVSAIAVFKCIAKLLEDYNDKPFFAFIDYFQGALINQLRGNCRVIGTACYENMQSHTVGVIRKRIAQGKMDLYLNQLGLNYGYFDERGGRAPDKEYADGAIKVWKDITIESDGRIARIFFEDDNPKDAGKYKLNGLEVISFERARIDPKNIAGKVIFHQEYDIGAHISKDGQGIRYIVDGRDFGGGWSSRPYTLKEIEEHIQKLIQENNFEKKQHIPEKNS